MSNEKKATRFGDVFGRAFDVDQQRPLKELLDKDILVKDCAEVEGKFGSFLVVLAADLETGELFTFSTGGTVLMKKIKKAKSDDLLPLVGKVVKEKDYYDIL